MGDNWPRLVLTAGLIGAVSLLEAISIAKALAERNGDTVDADQELLGARLPLRVPLSHHTPLAFQSSHSVATKQLPSEVMVFPKYDRVCVHAQGWVCAIWRAQSSAPIPRLVPSRVQQLPAQQEARQVRILTCSHRICCSEGVS